jgi:hypothetical protein
MTADIIVNIVEISSGLPKSSTSGAQDQLEFGVTFFDHFSLLQRIKHFSFDWQAVYL